MLLYLTDNTSINNIKLNDKNTIQTTGITIEEYMKSLDHFIVDWITKTMRSIFSSDKKVILISDKIIMETLTSLLSDKEYCNIYIKELQSSDFLDEVSNDIKEKIAQIIKIFEQSKENEFNTIENRKYKKL